MITKKRWRGFAIRAILLILPFSQALKAQDKNWTHFRGSNLNGISAAEKIPLTWDESSIVWKTALKGKGHSSPVVYDNQVWITTASPDGKELNALCTDFRDGKTLFDIKVFTPEQTISKHSINTYASPTPCIEKGFVYVHYGSLGTACIKTSDGSVVWTRTDLKCKHVQGPGSSPVLYKNLLILHYEGTDVRFIIALDKKTGKEVWRATRPEELYKTMPNIGTKAYVTPIIIKVKGKDQLISNGSAACFAYDPNTGEEIWRVVRGAESTVPMPFYEDGLVYFYCGFMVDAEASNFTELIAVNPEGKGDITSTNVVWRKRDNQTQTQMLTPLIKDGLIYTANTRNMLQCIDAKTGEVIWEERQRSNFNSSPVWINGNIWLGSVKGDVIAVKEGRKYEPVAQFTMDSGIWATPAILRNSVILRTEQYLCRIGR